MPRALFRSKNLIGDGMNIYPALKTWWNTHQDWGIDLFTLPDAIRVIYERMGIPMRIVTDDSQLHPEYDFEHTFDCGKAFTVGEQLKTHIALAYCKLLDVRPVDEDWRLRFDTLSDVELEDREKNLILISPFSKSCSSQQGQPPNKMLPWEKWKPILRYLRNLGRIGVLGTSDDRQPSLELSEDEYFTGLPLGTVAKLLKASRFVVTIDNGISHLAASQLATTILFYPACLAQHWITPINPNLALVVQLNPVTVDSADLTLAIKQKVLSLNL